MPAAAEGILNDGTPCCHCCCSVAQLCPTFCDPVDCSTPGFSVLHHLLEFAQTHVHWVGDAIQPFHPLLPPLQDPRWGWKAAACWDDCRASQLAFLSPNLPNSAQIPLYREPFGKIPVLLFPGQNHTDSKKGDNRALLKLIGVISRAPKSSGTIVLYVFMQRRIQREQSGR